MERGEQRRRAKDRGSEASQDLAWRRTCRQAPSPSPPEDPGHAARPRPPRPPFRPSRDLVPAAWEAPQPPLPPSRGEGPERQGRRRGGWRGGGRLGARPRVLSLPSPVLTFRGRVSSCSPSRAFPFSPGYWCWSPSVLGFHLPRPCSCSIPRHLRVSIWTLPGVLRFFRPSLSRGREGARCVCRQPAPRSPRALFNKDWWSCPGARLERVTQVCRPGSVPGAELRWVWKGLCTWQTGWL